MSEKREYNLRSGGSKTVTLPVKFKVFFCSINRVLPNQVRCQTENDDGVSNVESDTEQTGVQFQTKVLGLINK